MGGSWVEELQLALQPLVAASFSIGSGPGFLNPAGAALG
jgi:hypothetical protein